LLFSLEASKFTLEYISKSVKRIDEMINGEFQRKRGEISSKEGLLDR